MLAASGCADDASEPAQDAAMPRVDAAVPLMDGSWAHDAGEGCRTYVADSLIDHACFHELMGPHAERTAGLDATASGIDVDRAHTSFRVRLPASASGGFRGVLTYQARARGDYAIFSRDASLRVRGATSLVEPTFSHRTEICPALPEVDVYALDAQTYTLEVESDRPDVVLVIESMNEGTVEDAYRVDCQSRPRPQRDAAVFTLDASSLDASMRDADDASPEAGAEDAGMCQLDPVLEHSCLHAQFGPYADVSAATGAVQGPDVSKVHTAWRTTLPSGGAGKLSLRPTQMGEYVFYLDRALPLSVHSESGPLSPVFSEPVSTCMGISDARVYALTRGVRYDVELGPTTGDAAMLIIENVRALAPDGWTERYETCP